MSVCCNRDNCGHDYRWHDSGGCNFTGCNCEAQRSFIQPEEYDDGEHYVAETMPELTENFKQYLKPRIPPITAALRRKPLA